MSGFEVSNSSSGCLTSQRKGMRRFEIVNCPSFAGAERNMRWLGSFCSFLFWIRIVTDGATEDFLSRKSRSPSINPNYDCHRGPDCSNRILFLPNPGPLRGLSLAAFGGRTKLEPHLSRCAADSGPFADLEPASMPASSCESWTQLSHVHGDAQREWPPFQMTRLAE